MKKYRMLILWVFIFYSTCQAQNISAFEGSSRYVSNNSKETIHTVTWDDTLISIGQQYGVPYPLIAWANGLDVNDTIWVGQKLIIPTGARTEDLIWLLGLWAGWFILAIPIYGRRWAKWCK